ncbi:polysaccharide lyase 8 family protein [Enterovibrio sp. ZSDZ35]|uniref:Polysaccharide lyase 8 family protein n=1 Tax=Enterovibrio qingdaonensis TaxID=2899818 RepID=A0ABT5QNS3_9GAMM|nr:polysaccharide lyase 8 family protein [Enterovibrio sp. ZSDZ35]MDD1782638.1 polysaccharide lyase 8 family protein [Enterovibrio sp. ZSDZ35]
MNIKTSVLALAIAAALAGCHSDSEDLKNPSIGVDPEIPAVIDYDLAVNNWASLWTPPNTDDAQYQLMIEAKLETAAKSYTGFTKDNAEHLWADLPLYKFYDKEKTVDAMKTKTSFVRLRDLAVAYTLGDPSFATEEVLADILFGMEFLLKDFYNADLIPHKKDNWHEWEIGTPKIIHDIASLIYEHVPEQMMKDIIAASRAQLPDPTKQYAGNSPHNDITNTGANRVDTSMVVLQRGIFDKNMDEIKLALAAMPEVLEPVTREDGFHDDGSFIQHEDIPYIGTYGMILLSNISRIMVMLDDTGISLDDERYKLVDEYLFSAVEPFLYKGQMMEAVSGRAIARGWSQNKGEGRGALSVLLRYYDSREGEVKQRLGGLIKEQLQTDTDAFFEKATDFKVLDVAERILNDTTIEAAGEVQGNFLFHNMDRMVHRGNGYALSVSLHSDRIGNYECGANNTENTRGWYTGDGMVHLYDADHNQFTDWYPLVDQRKMQGATTTVENIGNCKGRNTWGNKKKDMKWVGGTSNGEFGVIAADFFNSSQGVDSGKYYETFAKKSYFGFDDEIVMLGSDIRSERNNSWSVATHVENRKLLEGATNKITIDGNVWAPTVPAIGASPDYVAKDALKTYHVEGNVPGSQLGVYLPNGDTFKVGIYARQGNWKELYPLNSSKMADTAVSGHVLQTWFPHDTTGGRAAEYAYVMLPSHSAQQTTDYANNPDVEIVAQTAGLHAVVEKTQHAIAANSFSVEAQESTHVNTQGELSVLMVQEGDIAKVWISQPTRSNQAVKVSFPQSLGYEVIEDSAKRVTSVGNDWQVDTNGLDGEPYFFSYRIN